MRQTIEHGMFARSYAGSAPHPVVFIHGLGESGLCFEKLAARPELDRWNRLIPDLPGYGRSIWPETTPSLEDLADHVAAWLGDRHASPATVVGHSMGGVLGALLAERHPRTVRALVNVEGNISLGDCVFSGRVRDQSLEEFVGGGFDALQSDVARSASTGNEELLGYYCSMRLADPRCFHAHSHGLLEHSADGSMAARLAQLPMPLVYVSGIPRGVSVKSQELLDAAGIANERIEPSGHWPFIDQQGRFLETLVDFLNRD